MTSQTDTSSLNSSSTTGPSTLITAIFTDHDTAETAYNALLAHGFSPAEVNVVMTNETRKLNFDESNSHDSALTNKAMEGARKAEQSSAQSIE